MQLVLVVGEHVGDEVKVHWLERRVHATSCADAAALLRDELVDRHPEPNCVSFGDVGARVFSAAISRRLDTELVVVTRMRDLACARATMHALVVALEASERGIWRLDGRFDARRVRVSVVAFS